MYIIYIQCLSVYAQVYVYVFLCVVYEYVCVFVFMKEQISQFNETDDKSHRAEFDLFGKKKKQRKRDNKQIRIICMYFFYKMYV